MWQQAFTIHSAQGVVRLTILGSKSFLQENKFFAQRSYQILTRESAALAICTENEKTTGKHDNNHVIGHVQLKMSHFCPHLCNKCTMYTSTRTAFLQEIPMSSCVLFFYLCFFVSFSLLFIPCWIPCALPSSYCLQSAFFHLTSFFSFISIL